MSDVVIVRGKLTTYSSIKNDLRYSNTNVFLLNLYFLLANQIEMEIIIKLV